MLKELNDMYQNMVRNWVKNASPVWNQFITSEAFLKWMKLFHIYYFDAKEKSDSSMEKMLEVVRVASKEDVKDLVDAQRLVIDMLEEIDNRISKLEKKMK